MCSEPLHLLFLYSSSIHVYRHHADLHPFPVPLFTQWREYAIHRCATPSLFLWSLSSKVHLMMGPGVGTWPKLAQQILCLWCLELRHWEAESISNDCDLVNWKGIWKNWEETEIKKFAERARKIEWTWKEARRWREAHWPSMFCVVSLCFLQLSSVNPTNASLWLLLLP